MQDLEDEIVCWRISTKYRQQAQPLVCIEVFDWNGRASIHTDTQDPSIKIKCAIIGYIYSKQCLAAGADTRVIKVILLRLVYTISRRVGSAYSIQQRSLLIDF